MIICQVYGLLQILWLLALTEGGKSFFKDNIIIHKRESLSFPSDTPRCFRRGEYSAAINLISASGYQIYEYLLLF